MRQRIDFLSLSGRVFFFISIFFVFFFLLFFVYFFFCSPKCRAGWIRSDSFCLLREKKNVVFFPKKFLFCPYVTLFTVFFKLKRDISLKKCLPLKNIELFQSIFGREMCENFFFFSTKNVKQASIFKKMALQGDGKLRRFFSF